MKRLAVSVLTGKDRWFGAFEGALAGEIEKRGHSVTLCHEPAQVREGDIAVLLSLGRIVGPDVLKRNKHNLVAHASALPQGKGCTPLTWQILEGKNEIPLSLFEATEKVDSGDIYYQESIRFEGHELLPEMHARLGEKIIELVLRFIDAYPAVQGRKQAGAESFYAKRTPKDSEVDPRKTLVELFNHFRVADNDRYPVFFRHGGSRYVLRIDKLRDDGAVGGAS